MVVRGMKIAAPAAIERGNRRTIYRQSFASVQPPVDASVWAVPLSMLTPEQMNARKIVRDESAEPGAEDDAIGSIAGFQVERAARSAQGLSPAETLYEPVPHLSLEQVRPLMKTDPHWNGEVADASEFGLGLVLHRLVYSRLKVFQPLVARFTLPGTADALEFLLEVRRVQGVGDCNARVGGLLLINAANANEVRAARDLAKFTLDLQRERARKLREAS
jgi:hypothetical protein